MKVKERLKKLREMTADELAGQRAGIAEEMMRLRFQLTMGQTEGVKKVRQIRKDRARVLTVAREQSKKG